MKHVFSKIDYAMISFRDQRLDPEGPLARLGDVTGWLGWQTGSLFPNHTSSLGYAECGARNGSAGRRVRRLKPSRWHGKILYAYTVLRIPP